MQSNAAIRAATEADIPAITAIYQDEVLNGTATYELVPPEAAEMQRRFQTLLDNDYPYTVAQTPDGALLGYAYAGPYRPRPAYNWMVEDTIYLAREARGQGLGTLLLADLIARSEALGFRQMIAVIGGADNNGSIRVHARQGFEMIGTMKATGLKFGRWIDTVLMQRSLGEGMDTIPDKDAYPGTIGR
ncbi:putative phosphinothricin N-acetyltransferase (antibiotic resistance) protein [Fulvimarina pelagi HTCC2506]|uniref:Putative phosphinothricin N-acetyltransferase (Antibiotic resistance) protein n=1 Tax=Fulvimarina pelagi HTCC2506 TaxID=314231 RepID=Q0G4Z0_9HYPH|nr:GNAT family N-acetyltransferase [Fulvimarina pelagi]EAU43274.1 putative phosphinothricin N-acetyltransferase (antibiotic resistance) protein [Fulvimarina pelagi HTCC2506]